MAQAKVTPTANNTAIGLKKKGYDRDSIIDPTNQKDVIVKEYEHKQSGDSGNT
jgi:hypothetical protein